MILEQFNKQQVEFVIAELQRYGANQNHFEVDRVHGVILRLARGNVSRVSSLVDLAIKDYRDVLIADDGGHKGQRLSRSIYVLVMVFGALILFLLFNL